LNEKREACMPPALFMVWLDNAKNSCSNSPLVVI
jgi:hypothetical protein